MNLRLFVLTCLLSTASVVSLEAAKVVAKPVQGQVAPQGPKIRVLLEKDIKAALLEVKGPYSVVRKDTAEVLSSGNAGKRFVIHALHDGLRWGEEYPDCFQITVLPAAPSTTVYVNGIQYKGAISVYHCRDNRVTIVNDVPIEEFLKATLAVKLDSPLSREAMAACVIAARTTAFSAVKGSSAKTAWDIAAKDADYLGYYVSYGKKDVEEAVDSTRFMVLEQGDRPYPNADLNPDSAEELASRGLDAKKILQNTFPRSKLGVTAAPKPLAVR